MTWKFSRSLPVHTDTCSPAFPYTDGQLRAHPRAPRTRWKRDGDPGANPGSTLGELREQVMNDTRNPRMHPTEQLSWDVFGSTTRRRMQRWKWPEVLPQLHKSPGAFYSHSPHPWLGSGHHGAGTRPAALAGTGRFQDVWDHARKDWV